MICTAFLLLVLVVVVCSVVLQVWLSVMQWFVCSSRFGLSPMHWFASAAGLWLDIVAGSLCLCKSFWLDGCSRLLKCFVLGLM